MIFEKKYCIMYTHNASYFYSLWDYWVHFDYFENQIPLKPMRVAYAASQTTLLRMKRLNTVEPRYLELTYFELPLISKWKSDPCYNMQLWQQVTK